MRHWLLGSTLGIVVASHGTAAILEDFQPPRAASGESTVAAHSDPLSVPLGAPSPSTPVVIKVPLGVTATDTTLPWSATDAAGLDWDHIRRQLEESSDPDRPIAFLIAVSGSTWPLDWLPSHAVESEDTKTPDLDEVAGLGVRLSEALTTLLDTATRELPGVPLSIAGLPVEGGRPGTQRLNALLAEVVARLDVLVTSRTFIQDQSIASNRSLNSALPATTAVANGRRVYYRAPAGWMFWTPNTGGLPTNSDDVAIQSDSNALAISLADVPTPSTKPELLATGSDRHLSNLPLGTTPDDRSRESLQDTRNRATPESTVESGGSLNASTSLAGGPKRNATRQSGGSPASGARRGASASGGGGTDALVPAGVTSPFQNLGSVQTPPGGTTFDLPTPPLWNPDGEVNPTIPIGGSTTPAANNDMSQIWAEPGETVWGYWACDPFRTPDGQLWVGVAATALEGIDSVRFLVSGLGATSISEPAYHPDRGINAYWISLAPDQISGTQVDISAIVYSMGNTDPQDSPSLDVRRHQGQWNVAEFESGWTVLTPSADSRLIYVSNSGSDAQAANNQHGRAYYLPGDPEIGDDPTNPVGPISAYGSYLTAQAVMRSNLNLQDYPDAPQYPDWLLFKRGDEFAEIGELNGDVMNGGRSDTERRVFTAWGNVTLPRPRLLDASVGLWGSRGGNNASFVSLDMPRGQISLLYGTSNVLFEDCRISSSTGHVAQLGDLQNIVFRRTTIVDNFNPSSHVQGLFVKMDSGDLTVEECVFDRNGYKEDPNEPTTWTADIVSAGAVGDRPAGTGVQPTRTYFDRNMYLSAYTECHLRGNIISRGGGGASVQMRQGGVAERNLFIWNQSALGGGHPQASNHHGMLARANVVLHDDHLLPPGGWGTGINVGGWSDDIGVLEDNVIAHFHRHNNGNSSLSANGKATSGSSPIEEPMLSAYILDNAVYREYGGIGIEIPPTTHTWGVLSATVSGNAVSTSGFLSLQGDPSKPSTHVYSGNRFHSVNADGQFRWGYQDNGNADWRTSPNVDGTLSEWQSAGYDTDATITTDLASFADAVGWSDPARDIVSYMQAVDPTYFVDENVYVDEGASGTKQSPRQRVWEVLMSDALEGGMDEVRAKKVARRYHAFLSFISKARENRKGDWDTRWTAEAVNNYIREGFGKTALGGP